MPVIELEPKTDQILDYLNASPETEKSPESVLAILLERQAHGYRRGIDDDGHKIGLAFDPGGLAAIVSVAMARKLEIEGLLECVDAFYGLSAGGLNAAYAAAGQIKDGVDLYGNVAPDNRLVEFKRLMPGGRPLMDLDVLRAAITKAHPLDLSKITGHDGVPVVIGLTDMDNPALRGVVVKSTDFDREHQTEFLDRLITGCNYPIAAGGPMKGEDGSKYTDGGMGFVSALDLAVQDGCTHILSLANSPQGQAGEKKPIAGRVFSSLLTQAGQQYINIKGKKVQIPKEERFSRKILNPMSSLNDYLLGVLSLGLMDDRTDWHYNEFVGIAGRRNGWPYTMQEPFSEHLGAIVERIYPPDIPELPGMLTMDKRKLHRGTVAGRLAMRKSLQKV